MRPRSLKTRIFKDRAYSDVRITSLQKQLARILNISKQLLKDLRDCLVFNAQSLGCGLAGNKSSMYI